MMDTFKQGKYTVEMLPDGYIALNKELSTGYHPKLEALLSQHPPHETDIRLSQIAVYCGIVLDGTYTLEERNHLCAVLAGRLEVLREIVPAQTIILQ